MQPEAPPGLAPSSAPSSASASLRAAARDCNAGLTFSPSCNGLRCGVGSNSSASTSAAARGGEST
eukprot:1287859-Alexandrium_andersonii.AAC.1